MMMMMIILRERALTEMMKVKRVIAVAKVMGMAR